LITNTLHDRQVRINIVNEEPWFVAMDIANILGYSRTNKMLCILDEVDIRKVKGTNLVHLTKSFGNNDLATINESGLYAAIFGSTKPQGKEFKRWLDSEPFPSIRKTSVYKV